MTPEEEHHEEVIASSEGHAVQTEIHTEEEKKQEPHIDNSGNTEENVSEIVLNIDHLIQCQGSSSSSKSCITLEAKSETSNSIAHNNSSSSAVKVLKGEDLEGAKEEEEERVCRICQLSEEQSGGVTLEGGAVSSGLIKLGCGCKDELGLAHTVCAEAWFRLKGNRFCEICGETAKNISGDWDDRFIEKMWNERVWEGGSSSSQARGGGCWRGQPFCNFLMACLVIAFVLPWFFRVDMF